MDKQSNKKKKVKKAEPVTNCDQFKEVVAKCDHPEEVITNCDKLDTVGDVTPIEEIDITKLIVVVSVSHISTKHISHVCIGKPTHL